ncbi:MAG: hypothetical protein FWD44_00235 [Oscillospiraceae bacterium]|nr:hypothetical protein [Oscillospiraceae bacterium]
MGDIIFLLILAATIVCLVVFARMYISDNKKRNQNTQDTLADKNALVMVVLPHTAGLPVAEKTTCTIYYCEDNIEINASGVQFRLDLSKIHDISIKTDIEIQKQLVSSAGGAVGGAMLFGAFGALMFGRIKKGQIKTVSHYLIFTYSTDSGVDYIAFELAGKNKYVNMIIDEFNKREKSDKIIEL